MSALKEYLKLLPTALANGDKIVEAVVNKVKGKFDLLTEEEQEEIVKRKLICEHCPFNSKNASVNSDYKSDRPDDHCIFCGCNIDFKTESLSSNCGIENYNRNHPNEKMDLKWVAYKKTK